MKELSFTHFSDGALKLLKNYWLFIIACFLASAFLVLDVYLPLGIASGVSYVAVIILGLWFANRHQVFAITLITIALTIAGYFLSPEGDAVIAALNRSLTVAIIIATSFVVNYARRTNAGDTNLAQNDGIKAAIQTSHSAEIDPQLSSYKTVSATGFIGLGAAFTVLLIIFSVFFWISNKIDESRQLVMHTHAVQAALMDVRSTLQDAETGQRGFLLTGQENYLEPFNSAAAKLEDVISHVRLLTTDNQSQQKRLELMERHDELLDRIFAMIKGELPYSEKAVKAAAREIKETAGQHLVKMFPEGSTQKPSRALPVIWSDFNRFTHMADRLSDFAGSLERNAANKPGPSSSLPKKWEQVPTMGGMMGRGGMMRGQGMMGGGMMGAGSDGNVEEAARRVAHMCNTCHVAYHKKE
jgi:CHASE3 domain sensor protein